MKYTNLKIKTASRLALIFSDILSIIVPALFSYTFYDIIDGVYVMRFRTIFGIILFALSFLFWSQTLHAQYSIRRSFYIYKTLAINRETN